jgi:PPK2 family polyphosphate:nucleotide phosphotransferase
MRNDDFLIRPAEQVRLAEIDPASTQEFDGKADASQTLARDIEQLQELQDVFAAARTKALLIVLQGMDSAGKDGAIKHVMSGVNPQGVDVYSFKTPTAEELEHDFLWRCERVLPARGRIGIFNRSYYEEVAVVRVHPEMLARENVPNTSGDDIWKQRFEEINAFERHLVNNGTEILKFFLHISKEEQRKRLLKRLDDPNKTWKFSYSDVKEREYWDDYQRAYEAMLEHTSTEPAPWYVIPSNHKWFTRAAIANVIVEKLKSLDLRYPAPSEDQQKALAQIREQLENERA